MPAALEHVDDLPEGVAVLLEQVGDHDGHAPAHSHHAVHQHVRLLPGLLDELERLFEVPPDLVVLAVLRRDVEVERHLLAGQRHQA